MPFSPTYILLAQEAFLAQGSLSLGLTALRNATLPDKGAFYSGFFSTSIAFERVMKLVVVTDYMLQNSYSAPSKEELKSYGHNLLSLYASVVTVAARHGVANVAMPAAGSLELEILSFLSEFAKHSRYYNLDALESPPSHYEDPLRRWGRILNNVLVADAPRAKVQAHLAEAQALAQALHGVTAAIQHDMDGNLLTLEQVFSLPAMQSLATPHTMVRVFRLLSPLLEVLGELGHRAFYAPNPSGDPYAPLFSEFFVYFGGSDADIRRKKRWP